MTTKNTPNDKLLAACKTAEAKLITLTVILAEAIDIAEEANTANLEKPQSEEEAKNTPKAKGNTHE